MKLLDRLTSEVLVADGAMGTLLYSYGIDYCYEELNVTRPDAVANIHRDYVKAGADVIQTNTYGAGLFKLGRYGLEGQMKEINRAAMRLAKGAAPEGRYVLGTIGGVRGIQSNGPALEEIVESTVRQAAVLLEGDPDGLLLETYYDLEELAAVVRRLRKLTELPIVAQVSLQEPENLQDGTALNDAFRLLESEGADVVGVNCRLGPFHTIRAFEQAELPERAFLSAAPNASLPALREGRFVYSSGADYFGRSAVRLRNEGVRLIGGCCGTTPDHIREAKKQLEGLAPVTAKHVAPRIPQEIREADPLSREPIHEQAQKRRTVIVELDTPRHLETDAYFHAAQTLYEAGIDAVTLADNSLASPRISNLAMGSLLKHRHGVHPLIHITCRDRNLIGLQSHLMGLDALGIADILAITGDPAKVGDFPGASNVYDVSSMELIRLIKGLNEGLSFSGKSLRKKTNFSVAAAFNPNVKVLSKAVRRLEKKIEAGADYFITQPVYTKEKIIEIHEETKHLGIPIFIGIMPLTHIRNAEFLHNEVPGIQLSGEVLERMRACGEDRAAGAAEGVQIAKELIDTAAKLFNGIYLITPFLRYEMTLDLFRHIRQIDRRKESESYADITN